VTSILSITPISTLNSIHASILNIMRSRKMTTSSPFSSAQTTPSTKTTTLAPFTKSSTTSHKTNLSHQVLLPKLINSLSSMPTHSSSKRLQVCLQILIQEVSPMLILKPPLICKKRRQSRNSRPISETRQSSRYKGTKRALWADL